MFSHFLRLEILLSSLDAAHVSILLLQKHATMVCVNADCDYITVVAPIRKKIHYSEKLRVGLLAGRSHYVK